MLRPKGGGAGRGGGRGSDQSQHSEATDGGDVDQPSGVQSDAGGRGAEPLSDQQQQQGSEISNGPASKDGPASPTPSTKDNGGATPMTLCSRDNEGILPASASSSSLDQEERSEVERSEVDEFFSLLDTTLHLPEAQSEPLPDAPPPKVAFANGCGRRTSGRLGDRVIALRQ